MKHEHIVHHAITWELVCSSPNRSLLPVAYARAEYEILQLG
jgi:hypothetical protein